MATTTKPKPKAAAKTRRKRTAKLPPGVAVEPRDIPVEEIVASPFQPRTDFDQGEIDALAKSIEANGLIQPIMVRPGLGLDGASRCKFHYELVDGERRWRAVKQLGYKVIRADVGKHSDAQVRAIMLASAVNRKDLNAIEEARAFRQMIEAGDAKGPTALAKLAGLSQGQVSNRLRLLELPEDWQKKIISHEIPATHARQVLRYKDHPRLLAEIDKSVADDMLGIGGIGTVYQFGDLVWNAVSDATRPIGGWHEGQAAFDPTDEQRNELGIVSLVADKLTEERATNLKLWDKLQAEFHEANGNFVKANGSTKAGKKPAASNGKAKPASAKSEASLDPAKLWDWYVRWQRYLIADAIVAASPVEVLAVFAGCIDEIVRPGRERYWTGACQSARLKIRRSAGTLDLGATLAEADYHEDAIAVYAGVVAAMYWHHEDGPVANFTRRGAVPCDEHTRVLPVAKLLQVVPADQWLLEQAGPCSKEYWSLHSHDELLALAGELKLAAAAEELGVTLIEKSKAGMVKAFLALQPSEEATLAGLKCPKELKRIKPPKR